MHVPSEILFQNSTAEVRRGNILEWEQPLASRLQGEPLDLRVTVMRVFEAGWQSFRNSRVTLGSTAVVRPVGTKIDIVLITSRTQTYEPDIFANQGIDFSAKSYLLVKSTNHFHAGFQPVSSEIVYIAAPTSYPTDPATTPYRKASLQLWPRITDPGVAPIVRRIATSRVLLFTSMISDEMMLKAATRMISARIMNSTFRCTLTTSMMPAFACCQSKGR